MSASPSEPRPLPPVTPKGPRLARRAATLEESATVGVARRALELAAAGVGVVDLSVGEPDFPSPAVAVAAARRALAEGFTRYTASSGTPALRRALAADYRRRFGAPWDASAVLVTTGAKMALFQLAQALFEPGDEVVIPAPCWVSLPAQVRFAGAEPVLVPTAREDGFRIHAEALIEAMTERTRAVLVNAPANPTGGILAAAGLHRLAEACAERGALLISDETYERLVFDGEPVVSAAATAADQPETVVVVGSFSKTYAMTGWRVGFCLGPRAVLAALGRIQTHTTSNPTSFAMAGALAALEAAGPEVEEHLAELEARRALVVESLGAIPGVSCRPPAGAFYAFPHVAACYGEGCRGSVALAERLLEAARVAVVPGLAFGADDHLRLSFACSRETLAEGLERIRNALSSLAR